jgi:SlyX protein
MLECHRESCHNYPQSAAGFKPAQETALISGRTGLHAMGGAMDSSELNNRLQPLEERLAFQERAIDELNDAVLQQQQQIDQLNRQLAAITRSLEQLAEQAHGGDLPHEKPPHY